MPPASVGWGAHRTEGGGCVASAVRADRLGRKSMRGAGTLGGAMPTYEYVCKQCGHLFEIVQSMRDEPLRECPECGGELRKVFAPPAISFKGSGFYATDHGKKAKSSTGGDKEKGATPSTTTKDSAPAASSGSDAGGSASDSSGSKKEGGSS